MHSQDNSISFGRDLRDRVVERLGLSSPPSVDPAGLRALYGAWCANVPFDNVSKMMALRSGSKLPLPGRHAVAFFETWLTDGVGGTCWSTSNALFELAISLGFDAHRIAGCMRDLGIINHASVRVNIEGDTWLVDSSMLTNVPLPLEHEVFVHDDPVFAAEVEPAGATHVVWWDAPPNSAYLPCRLLADPVDHAYYLAAYESSRDRSPFNQRLYARRNRPGELLVLLGHTRFSKTVNGLQTRELSPDEVSHALREDIGISQDVVEAWVRAGGLTASFETPQGPQPPPMLQRPPSKR